MVKSSRISRRVDQALQRIVSTLYQNKRVATATTAILLLLAVILGVLIRTSSFALNGYEFFEFDSYIEYWQAMYVYEKGPLAWYTLTRENNDTHVFWHPWGRDFIYTSYPFLPMWIGTTYHLIRHLGLDLKQWAAIQPVFFAVIAIIMAFLATREVLESNIAGIIASYLFAVLPSAVERTVIGYVEKEGVASVFIFLFIYLYIKALKTLRTSGRGWFKHVVFSALSLALVGWLWGGYVFLLGTLVFFIVLSPLIIPRHLNKQLVYANFTLVVLSMLFVIPSTSIARTLGLNPPSLKGLAWPLLIGAAAPVGYYYARVEYKRLRLKKPLITPTKYVAILTLIAVGGIALSAIGLLPIGGRLAWALGLRFIQVTPLVESIAEHQSPLSSYATFLRMLHAWGVFFYPLVLFSPLVLSVLGALYLLYKSDPEKAFIAMGFGVAFYAYLNAVYMIGAASYFGVLVTAAILDYVVKKAFPYEPPPVKQRKKVHRPRTTTRPSRFTRFLALLALLVVIANTSYTAHTEYSMNSNIVYTFRAGVSDLSYYSDSWYKAVEVMRGEMPRDALVISWWDYGYGVTVAGEKSSVADGSTINETQIGIIGLLLTSSSTEQAVYLARLLGAKPNKTYLMIIEGVVVYEENESITISPLILARGFPGLVDWPKSLWMIRIGNGVVPQLREAGVNVSFVQTERFFRLYQFAQDSLIAPKLDDPEKTPLIYKIIVDAALYWAEQRGKKGRFSWYTGTEEFLDYSTMESIRNQLRINITYRVRVAQETWIEERPLAGDNHIKPFRVVIEPFRDPRTGELLKTRDGRGVVCSIIVFYEINVSD
jgi:dolichyl-diphosphooligosaccharide--protein glycosyltransferase